MGEPLHRLAKILLAATWLLAAQSGNVSSQVPPDAASDRRIGDYVYFQSFGEPKVPFEDLEDVDAVRDVSSAYFRSELATCNLRKKTCDIDKVYELADRFCQALEFHEAVTWRTSRNWDKLALHWVVCGFKK